MRLIICLLVLYGSIVTGGCGDVPAGSNMTAEATSSPVPVTAIQGDAGMTPTPPAPLDSKMLTMIDQAKADLAQRLSTPVEGILLLDASSVTWPDASLGCPQEGMMYAQVLTPGYLIRLQAGDREYEYHAGRGTTIAYCENPSPPVPGTPGDV